MAKAKAAKKSNVNNEMFDDSIKASDGDLKKISKAIEEALTLEGELTALQEAVKNTNEKLTKLRGETLPALMSSAGVLKFTDEKTMQEVHVTDWLSCRWPTAEKGGDNMVKAALSWLKEEKAEDLIKCTVTAAYGRKEAAKARKLAQEAAKSGNAVVSLEEGIHNQTLGKFIREKLAAGKKVPMDVLSVETGKWADIKPVKVKK